MQTTLAGMKVKPELYDKMWNDVVQQDLADSEDKKLFVFVSTAEADSVCAVHILQVRSVPCWRTYY